MLRRYIVEYVSCKTCKSPDTLLQRGESRLYYVECKSCGSRRSVTAIKVCPPFLRDSVLRLTVLLVWILRTNWQAQEATDMKVPCTGFLWWECRYLRICYVFALCPPKVSFGATTGEWSSCMYWHFPGVCAPSAIVTLKRNSFCKSSRNGLR